MIAIAKTENRVMLFASFFVACKYKHANHLFRYTQCDAYDGGFIIPLLVSLLEEVSNVGLASLITLRESDTVLSLLLFKRSSEIHWDHDIGNDLPFLGDSFETRAVPDIFVTRATKRPNVLRSVLLEFHGVAGASLKLVCNASTVSCE